MPKKEIKKTCSKCNEKFDYLNRIASQTIKKLEQKGVKVSSNYYLCKTCLNTVLEQAYVTPLEKKIKIQIENRNQKLWLHRMQYLKKAQEASMVKNTQEALKNYQIYLKILEEYYEVSINNISPSIFVSQRDQVEKNIILTVFYELVRIFDPIKTKEDQFLFYLDKVVLFLPDSTRGKVVIDNMKKYAFSKFSTHKPELINVLKKFKKEFANTSSGGCYIATTLYNDYEAKEVRVLRHYRDNFLNKYFLGRIFINIYYFISPYFLKFLKHKFINKTLKLILDNLVKFINKGAKL